MEWLKVIVGFVGGLVAVGTLALQWPQTRGPRALLKRDLEILELLPKDSTSRTQLRESIDGRIIRMLEPSADFANNAADAIIGGTSTLAAIVIVIAGAINDSLVVMAFGVGTFIGAINVWAHLASTTARQKPPALD